MLLETEPNTTKEVIYMIEMRKLLVQNVLSYDLPGNTLKLAKGCDTMALCQILEITKKNFA